MVPATAPAKRMKAAPPGVPLQNLNRQGRGFKIENGMIIRLGDRNYEVIGITPGAQRITLKSKGRAKANG